VADPELRFTPSGAAVVNFTIAANDRYLDKQTQEWKDKDAVFLRSTAWRELAENIAESLTRGTEVLAQGTLVQREFETREGEKRTVVELEVSDIGPTLRFSTAKVTKATKSEKAGASW
jgi:single-strand DNA-binding protein